MSVTPESCQIHTWRRRLGEVASIAIFGACVAAVANHTRGLAPSGDVDGYHEQVRKAISAAPREFKDWVGVDVPVPTQAQALLRPTAILSRHYVNRATGEACLVMLVHCGDARDMLDHYPPNCYPGQGWTLQSSAPDKLATTFGTIKATDYEFSRGRFGTSTAAMVTNAMLLPDGTTAADMAGVESVMGAQSLRFYGVAQLQVFFDNAIAPARRRDIVLEMVEAHRNSILAVVRQDRLRD